MFQIPDNPISRRRRGRRGLTLTELMISLALVLLLVLAITQIFRVTASAISKGNATGEVVRGLDSVRAALQIDFTGTEAIGYDPFTTRTGILPTAEQPAIIIYSSSTQTYRSREDRLTDNDGQIATVDTTNDGIDNFTPTPYHLGQRWFRTDTFSFYTRGEFESQTNVGPPGVFAGNTTTNEAWVWYGHGRVYDGSGNLNISGSYFRPGEPTFLANVNHYYAHDFLLLRSVLLLKSREDHDGDPTTASTVVDDSGNPIFFGSGRWDPEQPSTSNLYFEWPNTANRRWWPNLGPIISDIAGGTVPQQSFVMAFDAGNNEVNTSLPANPPTYGPLMVTPANSDHRYARDSRNSVYLPQDSRVDVVGVDTQSYRERIAAVQLLDQDLSPTGAANSRLLFHTNTNYPNPPTWYDRKFARSFNRTSAFRFWMNPFVLEPLDPEEVSQATNYLLGGASHFIVEYAGDFITQTANGDIDTSAPGQGLMPDGEIDYTVDARGVRHIRWYGMPRDVDGDGIIPGPAARSVAVTVPVVGASNALLVSTDVRPLADYLPLVGPAAGILSATNGFPFEKRLPGTYTGNPEVPGSRDGIADYLAPGVTTGTQQPFDPGYLVAWGPGDFDGTLYPNPTHNFPQFADVPLRPAMIRVIVQSIDRQNRLGDPLSLELVFRVPAE